MLKGLGRVIGHTYEVWGLGSTLASPRGNTLPLAPAPGVRGSLALGLVILSLWGPI